MEAKTFKNLGGSIRFNAGVTELLTSDQNVSGVIVGGEKYKADAVILACGGFEANNKLREEEFGLDWNKAKVRAHPITQEMV